MQLTLSEKHIFGFRVNLSTKRGFFGFQSKTTSKGFAERKDWNDMKRIFILMTGLLFAFQAIAFAHTMPREEMYVGGIGSGCSLGYVKSVYGEPKGKNWFDSYGVKGVTYVYSAAFHVTGWTSSKNPSAEDDILVAGFTLKDNSLSTPSGITVGMPYQKVVEKFGEVKKYTYNGKNFYAYVTQNTDGPAVQISFYVDEKGTITEINEGTDY